jgi:hypothetical protein
MDESLTEPQMRRTLVLTAALVLGVGACESTNPVELLPPDELRAAPLSIMVDARTLVLDPYLWRDFMPIAPPNGDSLIVAIRVRSADDAAVPTTIHVDAAWVILDDLVWASGVGQESPATTQKPFYEAVARNGPKWGPGVNVDVVVRVKDSQGIARLLRAADRPIQRTD